MGVFWVILAVFEQGELDRHQSIVSNQAFEGKEQINIEHESKTRLFRLQSGRPAVISGTNNPTCSRQKKTGWLVRYPHQPAYFRAKLIAHTPYVGPERFPSTFLGHGLFSFWKIKIQFLCVFFWPYKAGNFAKPVKTLFCYYYLFAITWAIR